MLLHVMFCNSFRVALNENCCNSGKTLVMKYVSLMQLTHYWVLMPTASRPKDIWEPFVDWLRLRENSSESGQQSCPAPNDAPVVGGGNLVSCG